MQYCPSLQRKNLSELGRHGGAVARIVASHQEGRGFDSVSSLSVSDYLPRSEDVHVRWSGNSKLSVYVGVCLPLF